MNSDAILNTEFGSYLIEAKLGSGGMATVYRALDQNRQIKVALKLLHPHLTVEANIVRRFQREAEIIQKLEHPRIVTVYDSGEINGTLFLAMKYMPYGSLARRFANPTDVTLQTTARLLSEIASALDYAHKQGVIHRDLKLENILLDDKKQAALSDFGIASLQGATRLTMTGMIAGTPLTMSPEQAVGSPDVDYRSDLYSLGVVAYLMVSGYYPFMNDNPLVVMNQHLTQAPPVPSDVNPVLPPILDPVILKGLAKNPADRYQSAGEFAAEFRKAVSSSTQQTSLTTIHLATPNPLLPPTVTPLAVHGEIPPAQAPRRRNGLVVLSLVAALVIILGLYGISRNGGSNPSGAADLTITPVNTEAKISQAVTQTFTLTPTPKPSETPSDTPTQAPSTTSTLPPTLTSTAFPTLVPVPTFDSNARVSGNQGVNLRTGPSTKYELLVNLPLDTVLKLIGRTADSKWYQVELEDGTRGWAFIQFIETAVKTYTLTVTWQDTQTQIVQSTNPTNIVSSSSAVSVPTSSGGVITIQQTSVVIVTATTPPPPTNTPLPTNTLSPTNTNPPPPTQLFDGCVEGCG